eukprot:COSAG02_NODE_28100_length_596_cov_1.094567_2_plen_42_part_01
MTMTMTISFRVPTDESMFSERAPALLKFGHLMGPRARGTDDV